MAIGNMHKNLKFAVWFLRYASGQTDRQTYSSQYFTRGKVITTKPLNHTEEFR